MTDDDQAAGQPVMESPVPVNHAARMAQLIFSVAQSGDRAAFAELYGHFAPRLKSYLKRLGAANDTAEELVQETMLLVWRKAGTFDPAKASAGTWIFTIARNRRIDFLRRELRPELDPDDPAFGSDPDPAADDMVLSGQREILIRAALNKLPAEQMQVVALSFLEDKPHSAISEELGIPLGTVKSRLRLAFQRLRALVGDQL